ncbi:MAG: DUF1667 domain-containing protein [Defluviitaleaceae bacterium]|nr:DUF1667 domain-containing protein [Defluviitaleaceae bacterium]
MDKQVITCIGCPMGCELTVEIAKSDVKVSGNVCKIGDIYGREETTAPARNIATSVKVEGGDLPMLSIKTSHPIPKNKIMDCINAVHSVKVQAPINVGDIVLGNVANTGVAFVATRKIIKL